MSKTLMAMAWREVWTRTRARGSPAVSAGRDPRASPVEDAHRGLLLAFAALQLELYIPGAGELSHGEAKTFSFRRDGEELEGFLLRHGEELVAYVNKCPHWNVDLDMGLGGFYAPKVDRIFCRNHGALFEPATGRCDMGPCQGRGLEKLELRLEGDAAVVVLPGAEAIDRAG
jgi:nitrite reductase/ring-hydroxylating ferredoxin subunit